MILHKESRKQCYETIKEALKEESLLRNEVCEICMRMPIDVPSGYMCHPHHYDYEKPFDLIWCCSFCHCRLHELDNAGITPVRAIFILKWLRQTSYTKGFPSTKKETFSREECIDLLEADLFTHFNIEKFWV